MLQIFIEIYDVRESMSYVELPLYRGSSSTIKVFRLCTINIYVTCNSCTNFRENIFDRKKVINFFQLDLRFDPQCSVQNVHKLVIQKYCLVTGMN